MEVSVPVSGVNPEKKKDVILARGTAVAGVGGIGAAGSIGPLWWGAAAASMLVPVSIPVRVVDERCPPGVITSEFDAVFRRTSQGGVVFNAPR